MGKSTFYTTIENQVRSDGSKGLLYDHFDSLEDALAKFFTICAAAAVSEIPYHSAMIIQDNGLVVNLQIFDRRTDETPEEE